VEKHSVPASAQASPASVAAPAWCAVISGQNSNNSPASPSAPPPSTCGATARPCTTRASSAFQSAALENTTATRPLAICRLAFRKQTKFRQNRHSPCASTHSRARPRGSTSWRRHSSQANSTAAARPKR